MDAHGICGAHGGHETAEVRDVRITGEGRGLRRRAVKRADGHVSWTTSELSASTPTNGGLQPRTKGNVAKTAEEGAERFVAKWIAAEKTRAGLRHVLVVVVVCPNVTGRTKERIAQSKRVRAGSLVIQ